MSDKNARTVQELIQLARDGVDFYKAAGNETQDPQLKDLFDRMVSAKRDLIDALGGRL